MAASPAGSSSAAAEEDDDDEDDDDEDEPAAPSGDTAGRPSTCREGVAGGEASPAGAAAGRGSPRLRGDGTSSNDISASLSSPRTAASDDVAASPSSPAAAVGRLLRAGW